MGVENVVSSPHRRSQGTSAFGSPRKKFAQNDISFPTLLQRHRFLLTALVLLVILCTIYLYFAVTMGSTTCSGLIGMEKEVCLLKLGKETLTKGKLRLF